MGSRSDRYREIAEVFSVHGFGFVVSTLGLSGRFPFRRMPVMSPASVLPTRHVRMALRNSGRRSSRSVRSSRPARTASAAVSRTDAVQTRWGRSERRRHRRPERGTGLDRLFDSFETTAGHASIGQATPRPR